MKVSNRPCPKCLHGLLLGSSPVAMTEKSCSMQANRSNTEKSGLQRSVSPQEDAEAPGVSLSLPKNRSTGSLAGPSSNVVTNPRIRFSKHDASLRELENGALSSFIPEQELAVGPSGLRRIRQQPLSRVVTQPPSPESSFSLPQRSASMSLNSSIYLRGTPGSFTPGGSSSPTLKFAEDLSRFPSESLHSFSFAQQSEDVLHSRQNLLRRSIDFMRDKLGRTNTHPGLMTAQAKVSGDAEIQSMMDLLAQANMLGHDVDSDHNSRTLHGPLTGPAYFDQGNIFEKAFVPRPKSPDPPQQATRTVGTRHNNNNLSAENTKPPVAGNVPSPTIRPAATHDSDIAEGRSTLKRTLTDLSLLSLQTKLGEAMARPYASTENTAEGPLLSPILLGKSLNASAHLPSVVHGNKSRWAPPSQAIFTTEVHSPWTILAANDLACLVFGVTKAEVKKLGILELVKEDERAWLEEKLSHPSSIPSAQTRQARGNSQNLTPRSTSPLTSGNGVTAKLLSKPSSRQIASQKNAKKGASDAKARINGTSSQVAANSGGVLLCGDVIPIQKRNGATGSASLWVKEKKGGLIWVLEEIAEDTTVLNLDNKARVIGSSGPTELIWGDSATTVGIDARDLVPQIPISDEPNGRIVNFQQIRETRYYTVRHADGANIPTSISPGIESGSLRVSSFPHIAGIIVLSSGNLRISSSNSVFCAALFGQTNPNGLTINDLIPRFDKILEILMEDESVVLQDGIVVPEHSFRKASALLALREGTTNAATIFLHSPGLAARHRDGSDVNIDVQMRVVRSERADVEGSVADEKSESLSESASDMSILEPSSEIVYALWITYSRQLHAALRPEGSSTPLFSTSGTPHHVSPGQTSGAVSPQQIDSDDNKTSLSPSSIMRQEIEEAASQPISESPSKQPPLDVRPVSLTVLPKDRLEKKKISHFVLLEDLGQGAYGSVKLARYSKGSSGKVVLKYVTKRRILVDTWTRDRRLGTVPLEIHVLDYLRRDGLRHPNIVEMIDFFEDDTNYYIEMVPHGLPGMDLFDYIEMRSNIDESECRNIFSQVVAALHHLHTKALVVHRDIKDENIVLDGENRVKLIDFGSAAYIKNGPFDVFVGTIGKFDSRVGPRHVS